jgi:hypothetical protein
LEKVIAYKFTIPEITEKLQEVLDDSTLKLEEQGGFYGAESDLNSLDGGEVDQRIAQILGVKKGTNYSIENGLIFIVEAK